MGLRRMLRFAFALAAVLLAAPEVVRAADSPLDPGGTGGAGGTTGTTTITKEDIQILLEETDDVERARTEPERASWIPIKSRDLELFLNGARCACDTPIAVRLDIKASARQKLSRGTNQLGGMRVWAGNIECVDQNLAIRDPAQRGHCKLIREISDIRDLARGGAIRRYFTTVGTLFAASRNAGETPCSRSGNVSIMLEVDADRDQRPDPSPPSEQFSYDGEPPTAPRGVRAEGGNEALTVHWDAIENATDVNGFVVFCTRGDRDIVYPKPPYRDFQSPSRLCPGRVAGPSGDGGLGVIGTPSDPFLTTDARYVCSDRVAPTQTSARIEGLQNGAPYVVGVAALDRKGNASPIVQVVQGEPIPTRDFYQGYREAGGEAEGGFCAVGHRPAPRPVEVAGGALVALALVLRRARRRRP
jgi:hypothetical protein